MNLSEIMKKYDLKLSYLTGDLDFRIVHTYKGVAAFFRGIRFVDKNLYRRGMPWPGVLQVGPWGFCSGELTFSDKLLNKIQEQKKQRKKLTIDEALEELKCMSAVEDLVEVCKDKKLIHVITKKKFVFPKIAIFD